MKVLLDTNVLVAAYAARGTCDEVLEHCVLRHEPFVSKRILGEFRSSLVRSLGVRASDAAAAMRLLRTRLSVVEPAAVPPDACRDPKDAHVLGAAIAAGCQCLVTGDKDLRVLGEYRGVRIVSPSEFWRFESEQPHRSP